MFLIDGYNLLHAVVRGKATAEARDELLVRLEAFCREGNYRARIVFDATGGLRRREDRGPLEVRNVAQGSTADEEILAAIGSTDDRTAYTVVSNDREITSAAAKRRFEVVPCEEFAKRLAVPGDDPGGKAAPPGDVDYWMKEFGLEE